MWIHLSAILILPITILDKTHFLFWVPKAMGWWPILNPFSPDYTLVSMQVLQMLCKKEKKVILFIFLCVTYLKKNLRWQNDQCLQILYFSKKVSDNYSFCPTKVLWAVQGVSLSRLSVSGSSPARLMDVSLFDLKL